MESSFSKSVQSSIRMFLKEGPLTTRTPASDGKQGKLKPKERTEHRRLRRYINSGTQFIIGFSNLTASIVRKGSGFVNFGKVMPAATAQRGTNAPPPTGPDPNNAYKLDALDKALDAVFRSAGVNSDLGRQPSSSSVPPRSGKGGTEGCDFINTGYQNIRGLCNLTGVSGDDYNGIVNFGEFYTSF